MKQYSYRPMAWAMAAVLGGLWLPAAHAGLVTSQTLGFSSGNKTAVDTCGPAGGNATCPATPTQLVVPAATTTFNQFDKSQGVLTGVAIGLTSTRTQTVSGTVTNQQSTTTSQAQGGSGASVSATGAAPSALTSLTHSRTSTAGSSSIASHSPAATATNATLTVAPGSLDAYVGAGTTTVTRELSNVQATSTFLNGNRNGSVNNGTASTASYSVAWAGDLTMEYAYQLHALAAFDATGTQQVLDIDFGTHLVGASVADRTFSIFNAIGTDGVGLDLDAMAGLASPFGTDLALFDGLAAGGSNLYNIFFDTSAAGVFGSSILLTLSDADVGAASSRLGNYGLRINVSGTVVERSNQVPEPSMLALVGLGLLGVAAGRRRRM